jgi:hypothetical protein
MRLLYWLLQLLVYHLLINLLLLKKTLTQQQVQLKMSSLLLMNTHQLALIAVKSLATAKK